MIGLYCAALRASLRFTLLWELCSAFIWSSDRSLDRNSDKSSAGSSGQGMLMEALG